MYRIKQKCSGANGVSQGDLSRVYLWIICPVMKCACPAWKSNLSVYLCDSVIEPVKKEGFFNNAFWHFTSQRHVPTSHQGWVKLYKNLISYYFNRLKNNEHTFHHLLPSCRQVPCSLGDRGGMPQRWLRFGTRVIFLPWSCAKCEKFRLLGTCVAVSFVTSALYPVCMVSVACHILYCVLPCTAFLFPCMVKSN